MKRYAVGALCGTIAFGAALGLLIVGLQAVGGRTVRLGNLADMVLALSLINMVTLAVLQGPIFLLIRRFVGDRVGPGALVLAVIGLAPLGAFAAWLMFRESNETVAGFLAYIRNVPGEFLINLAPNIASTSVFALWMLSPAEPRRAQSLEP
jgi:cytochrome bd-type quinol oxidase subunit 2